MPEQGRAVPEHHFDAPEPGADLSALYGRGGPTVRGLCRLLLRNRHEAEDAAQQTFLSAYRSMLSGNSPRHPAAWLATIARNECVSRIQRRMREPLAAPETEEELPDPVAVAADRADLAQLWRAIAELPERQRQALLLREFSGLSVLRAGGRSGRFGARGRVAPLPRAGCAATPAATGLRIARERRAVRRAPKSVRQSDRRNLGPGRVRRTGEDRGRTRDGESSRGSGGGRRCGWGRRGHRTAHERAGAGASRPRGAERPRGPAGPGRTRTGSAGAPAPARTAGR